MEEASGMLAHIGTICHSVNGRRQINFPYTLSSSTIWENRLLYEVTYTQQVSKFAEMFEFDLLRAKIEIDFISLQLSTY